LKNKQTS